MVFPPWAQGVGWSLLLIAMMLIPICAFWTYRHLRSPTKSFKENLQFCFKPSGKWSPHERQYRTGRYVGTVLAHDIDAIRSRSHSPHKSERQFGAESTSIQDPSDADYFQRTGSFFTVPVKKRPNSDRNRNNRNEFFDDRPCASQMV